jgi:hypothetical protein
MRHIHADNICIAANDTSIEWQRMSNKSWANVGKSGSFTFFPDSQYRQKPAEPVMVDMWQWAIRHGSDLPPWATANYFSCKEDIEKVFPEHEIVCRIEGSKITVPEVSQ